MVYYFCYRWIIHSPWCHLCDYGSSFWLRRSTHFQARKIPQRKRCHWNVCHVRLEYGSLLLHWTDRNQRSWDVWYHCPPDQLYYPRSLHLVQLISLGQDHHHCQCLLPWRYDGGSCLLLHRYRHVLRHPYLLELEFHHSRATYYHHFQDMRSSRHLLHSKALLQKEDN